MAKKKKVFSLVWVFEPFQEDPSFIQKRMFGGLAIYLHGKMVMLLCEGSGEKTWKGQTYSFDIWDGLLFPTEVIYHQELIKTYPQLIVHPVISKWLYLPQSEIEFETLAERIAKKIKNADIRFGVLPLPKKKKKK